MSESISSSLLSQYNNIVHSFGTKNAPVYPDGFSPAILNQVHGNNVIIVTSPGMQGDGDAMVTRVPGIVLVVKTADCVPVLMYDDKQKVICAVHSGWRGIYNEVVISTLNVLGNIFNTEISSLKVSIGPSIEQRCYEVGEEVVSNFKEKFQWWQRVIDYADNRFYLNLRKSIEIQLINSGVSYKNVEHIELCTFCREDLFYSWRRDGKKRERMYSYIGLKGK